MFLICNSIFLTSLCVFNTYCIESDEKFNWFRLPLDLQKVIIYDVINDNKVTPKKLYKNLLNLRAISDFSVDVDEIEASKNKKLTTYILSQALVHAVKGKSLEIVKFLLILGASAKAWDHETKRPIIEWYQENRSIIRKLFFKYQRPIIEDLLIASGAIENLPYDWNDNQIIKSARDGDLENVIKLIKSGVNLNAKNKDGNTALICISSEHSNKRIEIAKELIKSGADINAKNIHGNTVLIGAVCTERMEIIKDLIRSGVDIEAKDNEGRTALIWSVLGPLFETG